jgi:hypothetical protein
MKSKNEDNTTSPLLQGLGVMKLILDITYGFHIILCLVFQ